MAVPCCQAVRRKIKRVSPTMAKRMGNQGWSLKYFEKPGWPVRIPESIPPATERMISKRLISAAIHLEDWRGMVEGFGCEGPV